LVSFKPILILPVLAGAFYAFGVIITRGLCREEPSFSLTVTHNLFYAGLGLFAVTFIPLLNLDAEFSEKNSFLFQGWIEMTVIAIVLISVTAVTHIISMTASIFAYQNAETTIVAPVEYTYLIFAAFIDYLFWSFTPSLSHIMGATIILGSGITITWREWIAQKSA
jgi:drug/metabolite transporter (DMT)-like permease